MAGLLDLPRELICHILAYLDLQHLLRCATVSTALQSLVSHSPRLQYKIHLQSNRLIPTLPPSLGPPLAHRLRILQLREYAWKTLDWSKIVRLVLSETGSVYEFVGGYYANGAEDQSRVSFFELPSLSNDGGGDESGSEEGEEEEEENVEEEEIPRREWRHPIFDTPIIDFTMDPMDDLLVLVAPAQPECQYMYTVHLRTLSTNEPHPLAPSPILFSVVKALGTDVIPLVSGASVRVQLSGPFLALLIKEVLDNSAQLEIWDWKVGGRCSSQLLKPSGIDDFTFLSSTRFLLVRPSGKFEVYDFQIPSETFPAHTSVPQTQTQDQHTHPSQLDSCTGTINSPKMLAAYLFPPLAPGYMYWYISMSCNPCPGHVPSGYDDIDGSIPSDMVMDMNGVQPTTSDAPYDSHLPPSPPPPFTNPNLPLTPLSTPPIFYPHPDERIHACCIHVFNPTRIGDNMCSFVFFVNIKTFLASPAPQVGSAIPWESWGPQSTRWFSERSTTDWQHALWGYRTVEIVPATDDGSEIILGAGQDAGDGVGAGGEVGDGRRRVKRKVRVKDYNPYVVKKALAELADEDIWEDENYGRNRVVTEPSVVPAEGVFKDDVTSSLAYREVESEDAFEMTDVMMDGERILLLRRGDSGQLVEIDVLMIG